MYEMFLWACLLGGIPTVGYYLFQYGRTLYARGREIKEAGTDPQEASLQYRAELKFGFVCCVWASFGLLFSHLLEKISQG